VRKDVSVTGIEIVPALECALLVHPPLGSESFNGRLAQASPNSFIVRHPFLDIAF
jgi:hypothetical protein